MPLAPISLAGLRRPLALAVAAALGVGACSTSSGETGRPFDPAGRRTLEIGWTTRGEVRHLFGAPTSVTPGRDGTETWLYEHTQVSTLTLPFYGLVRARQTPHRILTIRFQYGLVSGCTFFEERYASRGIEIVPDGQVVESCAR